jgi:hypothetical protein
MENQPNIPVLNAGRLRAAGVHLAVSLAIALSLVLLVTQVWYAAPFFELVQGRYIFLLMVGCDITLGPLMTLIIFNIRKPRRELVRDVTIIACVQFVAMGYGIYALSQVRPAYIVFNVARFNVTMANELVADDGNGGKLVPPAPWTGPKLVGARLPHDAKEKSDMIFSALSGHGDVFQMPQYFVDYATVRSEVLAHTKSEDEIARMLLVEPTVIAEATASYRKRQLSIGLLPLVIRNTTALAVVDARTADLLGIEPIHRKL